MVRMGPISQSPPFIRTLECPRVELLSTLIKLTKWIHKLRISAERDGWKWGGWKYRRCVEETAWSSQSSVRLSPNFLTYSPKVYKPAHTAHTYMRQPPVRLCLFKTIVQVCSLCSLNKTNFTRSSTVCPIYIYYMELWKRLSPRVAWQTH